jgi:hypothetical protein
MQLTSLHFRVKWLNASRDLLLETLHVASAKLDTAMSTTSITAIANANTITIPATNTAAHTIYETTMTPERLDRVENVCHVITMSAPIPTQFELEATTTATAMDLNDATSMDKQQDKEESGVGREEEEKGVEKKDGTSEREADR